MPQRNPRAGGKRGKTGLRRVFPFWLEALRVQNPPDFLQAFLLVQLARGRHLSARHPVAGGKVSRKRGFPLSLCVSVGSRESRISARSLPGSGLRDSRGAGFDVLTKCHLAVSAARRTSGDRRASLCVKKDCCFCLVAENVVHLHVFGNGCTNVWPNDKDIGYVL